MENGQGGNQPGVANESVLDEQARNLRRALPSERELVRDNMKSKLTVLFLDPYFDRCFSGSKKKTNAILSFSFFLSFFVSHSGEPTRAVEPAGRDDYQPRDQQADGTRLQARPSPGRALAGRETDPAGILIREPVSMLDRMVCVLVDTAELKKKRRPPLRSTMSQEGQEGEPECVKMCK